MTADPFAELDIPVQEPPDLRAVGVPTGRRTVDLVPASSIKIRPVHWLWESRIALGTLCLVGGREGIGKSTLAYTLAADLTRGLLPGVYLGQPRAVIVAATEDSWEHTIVPRLMAAGADLDQVFRVDVTSAAGLETGLLLPRDMDGLEHAVAQVGAALILLDPLMSRLDGNLDTHKDADVRKALEPLVALANRTRAGMLALIHLNKSGGSDPLTLLMGSRAFAAVARSVLFVMKDPEDDDLLLLGQPKNNLGRSDLPTLTFRIVGEKVADTTEGPVWTGRIQWDGESARSIGDALAEGTQDSDTRTATTEAMPWLVDYLTQQGGTAPSADVKAAGRKAGHSESALGRARKRLKVATTSEGFPRTTYWSLPDTQPSHVSPGESELTELTEPTGTTGDPQSRQSLQSSQSDQPPGSPDPTEQDDLWSTP